MYIAPAATQHNSGIFGQKLYIVCSELDRQNTEIQTIIRMSQPTQTEAISAFLKVKAHPELAALYTHDMEVQVNVAKENGELVRMTNELRGREWNAYTDGVNTWKPIRIPYKAKTEPEYTDKPISFPIERYVEGIGMTGWDWKAKLSRWVAFDFDAIVGHSDAHSKKLSDIQLQEIESIVREVPFVALRRSTSGRGLHLYVFLEPITTANHTEHAAVARSILSMLSGLIGHDLSTKVDICGGNMWVWHRKMTSENGGLSLVKAHTKLATVPPNWRDHVNVTARRANTTVPTFDQAVDSVFLDLVGERTQVNLDSGHRRLIEWLASNGCTWWWDQDNRMLVTHTWHLKEAHKALGMCGMFETESKGTERGADHNCFCFPLRNSGWAVRRFSPGCKEHDSWEQDGRGWTRCFYNRPADFATLARMAGGVLDTKGHYHFRCAGDAIKVFADLKLQIELPQWAQFRKARVEFLKSGKVALHIDAQQDDPHTDMKGWLNEKKQWSRVLSFNTNTTDAEQQQKNYDDIVRHLTSGDADAGWYIKKEGTWVDEPLAHIKAALVAHGENNKDLNQIVGLCVLKSWTLVSKPFQPEYPGNREWNRGAAQLAMAPSLELDRLSYPHWTRILEHLGENITPAVQDHAWCKEVGITTGAQYLMLWIACLIRKSDQPLPYLAFYSKEQDCGKSILHEAIDQILLTKGVMRADNALQSQQNFNGELQNSVLCVVEETDLSENKTAYNRIKDWVTSPKIMIRPLFVQGYMISNTTHWIQCSNDATSTPIFEGDSRIVLIRVNDIPAANKIPKLELMQRLKKEAPDFLAALLHLELPHSNSRLAMQVVDTEEKKTVISMNQSRLIQFINENCFEVDGHAVDCDDFFSKFQLWLDERERGNWSKNRIGRELPERFPRGWLNGSQKTHYGNMSFEPDQVPRGKLVTQNRYLKEVVK